MALRQVPVALRKRACPGRAGGGLSPARLLQLWRQVPEPQARPADGIPAYLEASDERTRRIYLRHGYADYGSPIRLPDGPSMYPMTREPALGRLSRQARGGLGATNLPLRVVRPASGLCWRRGVSANGPAVLASRDRAPGVHPARADEPQAGMGDLANAPETRFGIGVLLPAPVLARVHHASLPTITLTFRILAATGAVVLTAEGFRAV